MKVERDEMRIERFFLMLADRTRLRLLNLMRDKEVCVCFLVEVLQLPQPTISRHLAALRSAGLVSARKEGRWMHYRLVPSVDGPAARILEETMVMLSRDAEMERDRARLVSFSCEGGVANAPRPLTIRSRQH